MKPDGTNRTRQHSLAIAMMTAMMLGVIVVKGSSSNSTSIRTSSGSGNWGGSRNIGSNRTSDHSSIVEHTLQQESNHPVEQ